MLGCFFIVLLDWIQLLTYSIWPREKGVDKEDLADRNILLMVALGLCVAVAPAFYGLLLPLFKNLIKGTLA